MPGLTIRLKKKADGTAALSCIRADGTTTWQRQQGAAGRFFPLHDLTHYAVETVLGHRRGFFGLVAGGWDFEDFGTPWPRGPIPPDADPSEAIVGLLDMERATGILVRADELASNPGLFAALRLTDADLAEVRRRCAELHTLWQALPPGEVLELPFPATPCNEKSPGASE